MHLSHNRITFVSIHAPARGATNLLTLHKHSLFVSIHAPARGATYVCWDVHPVVTVSIHAPARGATSHLRYDKHLHSRFNSRTREGCDFERGTKDRYTDPFQFTHPRGVRRGDGEPLLFAAEVSIHAPARGATSALVMSLMFIILFQFTHPRGVRLQGWGGGCGAASTDLL